MSDVFEKEIEIPVVDNHTNLLQYFETYLKSSFEDGVLPVRFVVSKTDAEHYHCDVGVLQSDWDIPAAPSIFQLKKRSGEDVSSFNIALIVPTGVGAEFGGHAGDATPIAQLFGSMCDRLITHPNVVNASDINEMPENTLYVEGSVLSRLLLGTAGLQEVRSNRILAILEDHEDSGYVDQTVNAINAARACYGLDCDTIAVLYPSFEMEAFESDSGRAIGRISKMNNLFAAIEKYRGQFDAVALASIIRCDEETHVEYFESDGSMVNPWGGVEAMLTHTLSQLYNFPTAHGPMVESEAHETLELEGPVDARMAAEVISTSYMQCVFKGLQRSPRVITDPSEMLKAQTVTVDNVSVLVTPDGCLGLPILAALEQGIPVVAVRENMNLMQNPLEELPWAPGQFHSVETYFEAVGVVQAIRTGTAFASLRRPLLGAEVDLFMHDHETLTNRVIDYYGEEAEALGAYKESDFDYEVEVLEESEVSVTNGANGLKKANGTSKKGSNGISRRDKHQDMETTTINVDASSQQISKL